MGTTVTKEQNSEAAIAAVENLNSRFSDAGVTSEVVAHKAGKKYDFVRITCNPDQWLAIAKHLRHELGVNHCAMVTGTHYPEGFQKGMGSCISFTQMANSECRATHHDPIRRRENERR